MDFLDIAVFEIILIMFPIYVYLFYVMYNIDIDKKDNDLLLDFSLFTSLYLVVRFGGMIPGKNPLFIFSILLLLAFTKKRSLTAVILSIIFIVYYNIGFNYSLPVLVFEHALYLITYFLYQKNKLKHKLFEYLFIIIKLLFILYYLCIEKKALINNLGSVVSLSILFLLSGFLIKVLFDSGESIIRFHSNVKKLMKEKKVRDSLFKITHEIKNPIAVCKGYLDMFDANNKEHGKKYIPIVKNEIKRTLALLEDFSCMKKIKIEKEIMDINMLLEEAMNHLSLLLQENNIKCFLNIDDEEIYVSGDYNRLMQVFINMIKNSLEAIDQNREGEVSISSIINNNDVVIEINDNGIGILDEDLSKIKEPFYSTKSKGSGLGVSLSNEILEAHNGSLNYESKEGIGTKAIIKIPILKEFN
jgi:Signal transduction histidine kinase